MTTLTSLAISDPKFTITPAGIQFNEELTFEEWDVLGQKLAPLGRSIGFIIGDWINYGEERYGEKYDEALARTKITYQTLRDFSYVARKVELSWRHDNLSFEHHKVVAKLKTQEEKQHWLGVADQEGLSYRRLRKSINFGRVATEEETQGDSMDRGHITYLALLNRIRRWWQSQIEKAPVDEWDEERRQALKEDFAFVKGIYESL